MSRPIDPWVLVVSFLAVGALWNWLTNRYGERLWPHFMLFRLGRWIYEQIGRR